MAGEHLITIREIVNKGKIKHRENVILSEENLKKYKEKRRKVIFASGIFLFLTGFIFFILGISTKSNIILFSGIWQMFCGGLIMCCWYK